MTKRLTAKTIRYAMGQIKKGASSSAVAVQIGATLARKEALDIVSRYRIPHSVRIKDPDKFSKKLLPVAGKIDIVCIIRTHVLRSNLYTNILVVIQP